MADVTLSYKGSDILELSDSGSATLKTGGKYCEDDIAVEYVKPSGGGGSVNTPNFYVYELVDGSYVDRTQDRMSYEPAQNLLKKPFGFPPQNIKNIKNDDYRFSLPSVSATWLLNSGAGSSSNLLCDGLKVYVYNTLHFGFSSNDTLNQVNDGTPKNLIPPSFTASGKTPNYTSLCKGYTVAQITITVSNPTESDFLCKSVYITTPTAVNSPTSDNSVTGNEHCV